LKAEEIRTARDGMSNRDARETFRRMAETYERLADNAQARLDFANRSKTGTILPWRKRGDTKP
jgi:hypothetical protein